MKLTAKIKLMTSNSAYNALLSTMERFNEACNFISGVAFDEKCFAHMKLHKLVYRPVREQFGLSAQMAVRAIGKVAESYKFNRQSPHVFKPHSAIVYDQRILSFKGIDCASLLTLEGRVSVPMVISKYHQGVLAGRRVARQADLILQDNAFYLLLVIDFDDKTPIDPTDYIGVDMGIVNIAVDSMGEFHSGKRLNNMRKRHDRLRKKLQKKGTKSARRLLKKRSRKEARFAHDVNHRISKKIVGKAEDTNCGIALEDLSGANKATVRKAQRRQHHSWSFYQLRQMIEYKAKLKGIPVAIVDRADTSTTCPVCGFVSKSNRRSQSDFSCRSCGYAAHADKVAAINISRRAVVNQPHAEGF